MSLFYVECDILEGGCGHKYAADITSCPECGGSNEIMAKYIHLNPQVYVYDIESYPNIFTCAIIHPETGNKWLFEISDRKNDTNEFISFLHKLRSCHAIMVGFNNENYDYPVIHYIATSSNITPESIYNKSMSIIESDYSNNDHIVWPNDRIVEQMDLFKIHHYNNRSKATTLKALEFFMRMKTIQDLPYEPGTHLNHAMKEVLIEYNYHDVLATIYFYVRSLPEIDMRKVMGEKYNKNFTNHNDVKIGREIFVMRLEAANIACYTKVKGAPRQPIQTHRDSVELASCIPDYIQFDTPEFNSILDIFKQTTLHDTNIKALFKKFNTVVDGHKFSFGAGGIHSCTKGVYESDKEWCILDIDGEAFYPSIMIYNKYFPKHLGEGFPPIMKELITERIAAGKKSITGKALKLAANGTYGQLGDLYSPFYDLKTLLQVTLTGQLILCMFVEKVLNIHACTMIQSNTDGLTVRVRRKDVPYIKQIAQWWQIVTGIKMEYAIYDKLIIKDVNNYLATFEGSNSIKRKGCYEYDLQYHQDASALVIPKSVEQHYLHGQCIDDYIMNHNKDVFDFCLRAKVPKKSKLLMKFPEYDIEIPLQKLSRYITTKEGGLLFKHTPTKGIPGKFKRAHKVPDSLWEKYGQGEWNELVHFKNKSVYQEEDVNGICAGQSTKIVNDIEDFDWNVISYDYYIKKAMELLI